MTMIERATRQHDLALPIEPVATLLAPFTPYVAEEMYRNLVAGPDPAAPESVHLAAWPAADASLIDAERIEAMRLVQRLASLGRAARSKAGVKVRQPLPALLVGLRSARERALVEGYGSMLLDELNVKTITFLDASARGDASGALVEYVIKPNLPVLGPRLGKAVGPLRRAMQELDPAVATGIAQAAEAGETIEIGGVSLAPADLLIELRERAGAATAQDAHATVALTTTLTPALVREGTAREFVHRLQSLRREAGFEIADRIVVWIEGGADVDAAVEAHADYVRAETLAVALHCAAPPPGAHIVEEDVAGQRVRLGVRRA